MNQRVIPTKHKADFVNTEMQDTYTKQMEANLSSEVIAFTERAKRKVAFRPNLSGSLGTHSQCISKPVCVCDVCVWEGNGH